MTGGARWLAVGVLFVGAGVPACQCNPTLTDPPGEGILRVYMETEGFSDVDVAAISMRVERLDVVIEDSATSEQQVFTALSGPLVVNRASSVNGVPLLVAAAWVACRRFDLSSLTRRSALVTCEPRSPSRSRRTSRSRVDRGQVSRS